MDIKDVKQIAVIGAGNMGHQISTHCAIKGFKTVCTDISEEILKKAEAFVDKYLPGRVEKGRLTEDQAKQARTKPDGQEEEQTQDQRLMEQTLLRQLGWIRLLVIAHGGA